MICVGILAALLVSAMGISREPSLAVDLEPWLVRVQHEGVCWPAARLLHTHTAA